MNFKKIYESSKLKEFNGNDAIEEAERIQALLPYSNEEDEEFIFDTLNDYVCGNIQKKEAIDLLTAVIDDKESIEEALTLSWEGLNESKKLKEDWGEAIHYGYETERGTGNYIIYKIGNNPGSKNYDQYETAYIQGSDDIDILEKEIEECGDNKEYLDRVLDNYMELVDPEYYRGSSINESYDDNENEQEISNTEFEYKKFIRQQLDRERAEDSKLREASFTDGIPGIDRIKKNFQQGSITRSEARDRLKKYKGIDINGYDADSIIDKWEKKIDESYLATHNPTPVGSLEDIEYNTIEDEDEYNAKEVRKADVWLVGIPNGSYHADMFAISKFDARSEQDAISQVMDYINNHEGSGRLISAEEVEEFRQEALNDTGDEDKAEEYVSEMYYTDDGSSYILSDGLSVHEITYSNWKNNNIKETYSETTPGFYKDGSIDFSEISIKDYLWARKVDYEGGFIEKETLLKELAWFFHISKEKAEDIIESGFKYNSLKEGRHSWVGSRRNYATIKRGDAVKTIVHSGSPLKLARWVLDFQYGKLPTYSKEEVNYAKDMAYDIINTKGKFSPNYDRNWIVDYPVLETLTEKRIKEWIDTTEDYDDDEAAESEYEEEYEANRDDMEPDEDDIIISSCGPLGSRSYVSQLNREFGDYEEMEAAIKLWMKKNNFYPTVWEESDHGGYTVYRMD
jgi:hypothetical protein